MEIQHVESRTRVWLNNQGLQDIDPTVIIRDVTYRANVISTPTFDTARFHGARTMMLQRLGAGTVAVQFEVHEYDQVFRQSIVERIVGWAMGGGVLTCDDRPGKQLHVVCTAAPAIESTLKWTDVLSVEFTAFDNPFWEDLQPVSKLTLEGTSGSGTLYGPGSAVDPYIEVMAECTSDILTTITLTVGDTFITMEDIILQPRPTWSGDLYIYYDAKHIQHIERRKQLDYWGLDDMSLMTCRTNASSDDLLAQRGVYTPVSFVSDAPASVTFSARGLYT